MSVKRPLPESSGQINFIWKIEKFFSLPMENGTFVKSPMFLFSNAKWYLQICPNGDYKTQSFGWINLYLVCDATTEHHVGYQLGIRKSDGSEFSSKYFTAKFLNDVSGWDKVISREDLLKYKDTVAPNDILTVFCSIHMISDWTIEVTSKRKTSDSISTLSEDLMDSYHKKLCSDVTLKVQNKEFFASKFILMTRSTVFASMFDHEMLEKHSGVVEIEDCDSDSFEDFLLFLYTGKSDCVTSENALSLYKTADKYNLQGLKVECVRCMARNISVDKFCDIVHFASLYNEYNLLSEASDFFMKNAENILLVPEWLTLLEDKPSLANEMFTKYVKSKKDNEITHEKKCQPSSSIFTFGSISTPFQPY